MIYVQLPSAQIILTEIRRCVVNQKPTKIWRRNKLIEKV